MFMIAFGPLKQSQKINSAYWNSENETEQKKKNNNYIDHKYANGFGYT